jgi:oxygen-dependent protoporphyrinogen oxidase
VFLGFAGGMGRLVDALVERLERAGAQLRTNARVEAVDRRAGGGYRVATDRGPLDADAVVIAVPASAAAGLVAPLERSAGAALAAVEHASVALVALAWPAAAVARPLAGSGFLVPRSERRLMTACSWASTKWAHLGGTGSVLLRASAGRAGDTRAEAMGDDDLVERLCVELRAAIGAEGDPSEVRVTRWPGGFPQYRPGHLSRMAAAQAALAAAAPGVALAGAALGGVGVPACIGSGRAAAQLIG